MNLSLVTEPTLEPLSLGYAKDQLNITHTDDDALIEPLITAARVHVEDFTGRALVTQAWDWKFDYWPCGSVFRVPLPPLQSVTSITYTDVDGASQTWATTEYQVDAAVDGGRIALAYGKGYPALRCGELNAVTVRFVAGYGGPEDVPQPLKQAMLLLVAHWYKERVPVGVAQLAEMPFQVSALLSRYRMLSFGA